AGDRRQAGDMRVKDDEEVPRNGGPTGSRDWSKRSGQIAQYRKRIGSIIEILDAPLHAQAPGIDGIRLDDARLDLHLGYFEIQALDQLLEHCHLRFRIPDHQRVGALAHLHEPSLAKVLPERRHQLLRLEVPDIKYAIDEVLGLDLGILRPRLFVLLLRNVVEWFDS